MVYATAHQAVEIPDGVTVTVNETGTVVVQGPNGKLERTFRHPDIQVKQGDGEVVVHAEFPRRKVRALTGTWAAHIRNMIQGAQDDYIYKLKAVYSHFPIKAKPQGDTFVVENFLGEKVPRRARILPGATVKVQGDDVTVTGADLEAVSQTAANIEQACRVRGFDTRVFQDGIYITVKGAES